MNSSEINAAELNRLIVLVNNSEISSIKQTVTKIIAIINDPDSSAMDLKGIIEIDPPLSAKLLKLSNSAFYGCPKTISEIQDAIVCIGFDAVKELALSQKVCELFARDEYFDGYSRGLLWKHSLAVALCSKLIYRREFREHGENMYIAGLLHDIGIIVLDQFRQEYLKTVMRKAHQDKNNLAVVETEVTGLTHADIGMAIARNWEFPDELVLAIGNHHNPEAIENGISKVILTIFITDFGCQLRRIGYGDAPYVNKLLFQKCLMKLNIKEKALDLILDEVEKEISDMEKSGWM